MIVYLFETKKSGFNMLVTAESMSEAFDAMQKQGYDESDILSCRVWTGCSKVVPIELPTEGGWRMWRKFHSPDEKSFILVRRDDEVCFGMMCGGYRFIRITAEVMDDGFANALVVDDYFADGDEWMYLDDLKRKEE